MKLKELLLVVHLLVGFHFILHAQNHPLFTRLLMRSI